MKTLITFKTILLSLLLSVSFTALADGNDTVPPPPEEELPGDIIEIPIKRILWQRSLIDPIQAYYYIDSYMVEMEFNENIGVITIDVTNSHGVSVYRYSHDTATEPGCTIPLPPISDCYNITISGSRYDGYGNICI